MERTMRSAWVSATFAAAVLVAGCGEGRLILNVDVYSFMQGAGNDTLRYPPLPIPSIPPGVSDTVGSDSVKVVLPGNLGNSIVDSAYVFVIADLDNVTGTGNITVEAFLSADSSTIFSGSPAFSFGGAVSPGAVTRDTVSAELVSTLNSLFTGSEVWLAFRAVVANTGATGMQGTVRLRALDLRIVVQDEVF
jgi:hypothetical protein